MMKKIIVISFVLLFVFSLYRLFKPTVFGDAVVDVGGAFATQTATTTRTTFEPVKVLSENTGRRYALITNDSDTAIYLGFGASTTAKIVGSAGIRVNANGGTYLINRDNLWLGEVWATTTGALAKQLLVIED